MLIRFDLFGPLFGPLFWTGMRSWFTAAAMGGAAPGSAAVRESVSYVQQLIGREIARGTAAERIFVGGFSQGGCIAVQAALGFAEAKLGGVVAASTFLRMGGPRSEVHVAPVNRRGVSCGQF